MRKQRVYRLLIVGVIVCSLIIISSPIVSYAEEIRNVIKLSEYTSGDYRYEVHSDNHSECTIKKYIGDDDYVVIPSTIEGKTVVELAYYAFGDNKNIQSVYIPDTVEQLQSDVFKYCTSLVNVRFQAGIKEIPSDTFGGCESLESIIIPDSVESIGSWAFQSCTSLENVVIGSNVTQIGYHGFYNCDSLQSIVLPKSLFTTESTANTIFEGCDSLESITIESGGDTIPDDMFAWCGSFSSINIPEGIKTIGANAFRSCSSLRDISFPNSLEYVGNAFYNCKQINTIKLGNNVKEIKSYTFDSCDGLKDFYNYSMNTKYPNGLFDDSPFVTLHGFKGSTTEEYANRYGIQFVPLPGSSMYRLYNSNSGEHFYTSSTEEKNNLISVGWFYEGGAWIAPESSSTPVYRLYNPNNGDHHYTTDSSERDMLQRVGWKYEGIGWYSADSGSPLLRLYNPNAHGAGSHHYTTDASERDYLVSIGWQYEGIGWYGV